MLLSFLLNYFLIKRFDIIGAAYAMVLVWFLFFIFSWIISNKIYPMPWSLKNDQKNMEKI
jgi:Na+-driven multidrug efflux pump